VGLWEDVERIAASAAGLVEDGEQVEGVVPAQAEPDERTYLCAFVRDQERTWLVLDDESFERPVFAGGEAC